MFTKTNKRLFLILGALVAFLVIATLTKTGSKSAELVEYLTNYDVEKVSGFKLYAKGSSENPMKFAKEGDLWYLLDGDKKCRCNQSVASLVNEMSQIKPTRLASKRESKWKKYEVNDSLGTKISIATDQGEINIILGKMNFNPTTRMPISYMRLEDSDQTYAAASSASMMVGTGRNNFRFNEVIPQIQKDSIVKIIFEYAEGSFSLEKRDSAWTINQQPIADSIADAYLSRVEFTSSQSYFDENVSGAASQTVSIYYNGLESLKLEKIMSNGTEVVRSSLCPENHYNDAKILSDIFVPLVFFSLGDGG